MYKVRARHAVPATRHAVLSISVGNPMHEGEKFAATMEWVTRRFDTATVCISDSFQRYKLQLDGLSPLQSHTRAIEMGSAWANRNAKALLRMPGLSFTRWDMWRRHPDFADLEDSFAELSVTNGLLAQTVGQDAAYFLQRREGDIGDNAAMELCRAAVIEELAVHTLQARQYRGCRIYPGDQIESLRLIRSGAVGEAPWGLQDEIFVRVNLERRAAFRHAQLPAPSLVA